MQNSRKRKESRLVSCISWSREKEGDWKGRQKIFPPSVGKVVCQCGPDLRYAISYVRHVKGKKRQFAIWLTRSQRRSVRYQSAISFSLAQNLKNFLRAYLYPKSVDDSLERGESRRWKKKVPSDPPESLENGPGNNNTKEEKNYPRVSFLTVLSGILGEMRKSTRKKEGIHSWAKTLKLQCYIFSTCLSSSSCLDPVPCFV